MTRRGIGQVTIAFAIFAVAVSLGCVRLGFWQLSRWGERRALNTQVESRLQERPVPIGQLASDTSARFRRAVASGTYDFDNEFAYTSRSRNGAPGVHLLTPLRFGDSAVLVNRGWVYTPDGMRIDHSLWHEDSAARVEGFAEVFFDTIPGPVTMTSTARGVRYLVLDSIQARLPYPILDVILVQRLDSGEFAAAAKGVPVRADPPPLSEGPHRAYAVQWFSFALVGVTGTVLVMARDRRRRSSAEREET